MAEVDVDEVGKRRLPPWMLGVSLADRPRKSDSSEVVPVREKLNKEEKERLGVDSISLVNRGKEERTRRLRHREKDIGSEGGGISIEGGLQKKKKRPKKRIEGLGKAVQEAFPRKKRKLQGYEVGNGEENRASSSPCDQEDEELTVEDLMSIAEEYVKNADNKKEHQRKATGGRKLDKQLSAASVLFGNESGVSTEAARRSEVPGTTATSSSLSNFTSSIHKDQKPIAKGGLETFAGENDGGIANQRRTGDPTQDMLDLFLGPLLAKPRIEERKLEFVEEDISLDSQLNKNEVLQETMVPVATKKKSSLKDKVTMLLG